MLSADACSYIFTSEQIKPLFVHLAERFAGGSISFDAENQKGVKSNKIIRKSGNTDSLVVLAVDNAALMFAAYPRSARHPWGPGCRATWPMP